jgi:hypothetical protein
MTIGQYNNLEELQQAEAAWNKGVLIAEKNEPFHKIRLYQLHNFYIEVTWHMHFNVILKVKCFSDTDHLKPYLQKIDINGLFDADQ